jgi:hypothetical protein
MKRLVKRLKRGRAGGDFKLSSKNREERIYMVKQKEAAASYYVREPEIRSFDYEYTGGVLHELSVNDEFSNGVHQRLIDRGFVLLPGGNETLSTYYDGSSFTVVVCLEHRQYVIYVSHLEAMRRFMREIGCAPSLLPLLPGVRHEEHYSESGRTTILGPSAVKVFYSEKANKGMTRQKSGWPRLADTGREGILFVSK